jgi:hypothetical protein
MFAKWGDVSWRQAFEKQALGLTYGPAKKLGVGALGVLGIGVGIKAAGMGAAYVGARIAGKHQEGSSATVGAMAGVGVAGLGIAALVTSRVGGVRGIKKIMNSVKSNSVSPGEIISGLESSIDAESLKPLFQKFSPVIDQIKPILNAIPSKKAIAATLGAGAVAGGVGGYYAGQEMQEHPGLKKAIVGGAIIGGIGGSTATGYWRSGPKGAIAGAIVAGPAAYLVHKGIKRGASVLLDTNNNGYRGG